MAFRLSRQLAGLDLSVYVYRGFWRDPSAQLNNPTSPSSVAWFFPDLSLYGLSAQRSGLGGVFSMEAGYYDSRNDRSGTRPAIPNSQSPVGYDLLVAIPPHRGPGLLRQAGLANEAGWVPVNRATLSTQHAHVYAIGDVTTIPMPGRWKPDVPLLLPKAGVFAHGQALVVARRIAAEVAGTAFEEAFCANGYCMLEAGEDLAGFAFGNFVAEPNPDVRLRNVGKAWHAGKVLFEQWWRAPFGFRREILGLAIKAGGKAYGVPVVL